MPGVLNLYCFLFRKFIFLGDNHNHRTGNHKWNTQNLSCIEACKRNKFIALWLFQELYKETDCPK